MPTTPATTPTPPTSRSPRRHFLHVGLALGGLAWLPAARACEFETGTLRVTHPWALATEPGEDSAVFGLTLDQVQEADRLVRIETPVAAGAQLVGGSGDVRGIDLAVEPGDVVVLAEHGTHVRLTGLKHPLLPGRQYPLVLAFEKSGEFNATLSIDYVRFK